MSIRTLANRPLALAAVPGHGTGRQEESSRHRKIRRIGVAALAEIGRFAWRGCNLCSDDNSVRLTGW
jgi:hypothetical protein